MSVWNCAIIDLIFSSPTHPQLLPAVHCIPVIALTASGCATGSTCILLTRCLKWLTPGCSSALVLCTGHDEQQPFLGPFLCLFSSLCAQERIKDHTDEFLLLPRVFLRMGIDSLWNLPFLLLLTSTEYFPAF